MRRKKPPYSILDHSDSSPIRTVADQEKSVTLENSNCENLKKEDLYLEKSYEETMCSGLTEELEKIPQSSDILLNDELESIHNTLIIKSEPGLVNHGMVNDIVQPLNIKQEPLEENFNQLLSRSEETNTKTGSEDTTGSTPSNNDETFVSKYGRKNKSTEARFRRKYKSKSEKNCT